MRTMNNFSILLTLQLKKTRLIYICALSVLSISVLMALLVGSVPVKIMDVWYAWTSDELTQTSIVINYIRMPRIVLAGLVGASLGMSGAIMQGLFRNPLADPRLVGISSGAALSVAITIVFAGHILQANTFLGALLLPIMAFCGGICATFALYYLAKINGSRAIGTLLLAGIGLGAIMEALTGLMSYLSDDQQLRDITFWLLGSIGGATWLKVGIVCFLTIPAWWLAFSLRSGLNTLTLGENDAYTMGVNVERLKTSSIIVVATCVGVSVAMTGIIGFIGLIVPHIVRLICGASYQVLLPMSAILGATLLISADILARIIASPAEIPIGIITAALGGPFFLWLLLKQQRA